jgi:indole-3-glycerol phosphate synthase
MTILDTIVAQKQIEVARLPAEAVPASRLREAVRIRGDGVRDFLGGLRNPRRGDIGLIAEVKKASPSLGVIRPDFDPVRIAREYEQAGASCLSVLTDERFFQGALGHLRDIRGAVGLPLLRKDFIVDERQILEAIEWGADAILLIVAILTDEQVTHFHALAEAAGLAVLVEVHDETEMTRALRCGARMVGVNNRDLKSYRVDQATTERLAPMLSAADDGVDRLLVGESGIHVRADVERLKRVGAKAILVGESLMKTGDLPSKAAELLGLAPPAA